MQAGGTPKLALVTSSSIPWLNVVVSGVRRYEREANVHIEVRMPKEGRVEQQDAILHELVKAEFSAVAVDPVDPSAQVTTLSDVAAHSRLITYINDVPESGRLLFVGTDS